MAKAHVHWKLGQIRPKVPGASTGPPEAKRPATRAQTHRCATDAADPADLPERTETFSGEAPPPRYEPPRYSQTDDHPGMAGAEPDPSSDATSHACGHVSDFVAAAFCLFTWVILNVSFACLATGAPVAESTVIVLAISCFVLSAMWCVILRPDAPASDHAYAIVAWIAAELMWIYAFMGAHHEQDKFAIPRLALALSATVLAIGSLVMFAMVGQAASLRREYCPC